MFLPAQYAGSIGKFSAGVGLFFAERKLEASLLYGISPNADGGPIHTATFKLTYLPFRIAVLENVSVIPLETGIFLAQHFSRNLSSTWDRHYPKGYYWWPKNSRQHVFIGSSVRFGTGVKVFPRAAIYFEANTNDLYLYSYLPNTGALRLTDILFMGVGARLYFQQ